jgi:5-methyltetrahydrofolate--homocysteine methyltransferase
MLKGAGYEVIDLGVDVSIDKIVNTVKETQAPFLGLSALLTTTMRNMGEVVEKLQNEGIRDQVKICIGGAPTSQDFSDKIGADAHCTDAFAVLDWLKAA